MKFGGGFATMACLQLLIFANGFFHVEGRKGFGGTEQEWGYANVRPYAKMFWWLYYTTSDEVTNVYDKPLLIWLQGGPGASSTGYGNFEELGPLDLDLKPRNFTWVKDYNVLFIDNPVGAGYSYTENYMGFAKNNAQIAADLLACIKIFYAENPKWLSVPTFITSESYGGKMAAEFALIWALAQKSQSIKSNLQGVVLIDSWISPIDSVLSWASFLLQTGMVEKDGYDAIQQAALDTKTAVTNKLWTEATDRWGQAEQVILQMTQNINFYNILYKSNWNLSRSVMFQPGLRTEGTSFDDRESRLNHLMNNDVKKTLGLNVTWGAQQGAVFRILAGDFMQPVINEVERLLNEFDIEVFVITGQLDLIVATPGTVAWVDKIKWRNATDWHKTTRNPLVVDNVIEGYIKEYKNFKLYWVNRSGHMVPRDNPAAMAAILQHLTNNSGQRKIL